MAKKVAVIFTGGTISMKVDPRLKAAIPSMSSEDIMSMVTNIDQIAELDIVEFGKFPGPHMTPEKMMELKDVVESRSLLLAQCVTGRNLVMMDLVI